MKSFFLAAVLLVSLSAKASTGIDGYSPTVEPALALHIIECTSAIKPVENTLDGNYEINIDHLYTAQNSKIWATIADQNDDASEMLGVYKVEKSFDAQAQYAYTFTAENFSLQIERRDPKVVSTLGHLTAETKDGRHIDAAVMCSFKK